MMTARVPYDRLSRQHIEWLKRKETYVARIAKLKRRPNNAAAGLSD
jgi:hypothetical protein